MLLKGLFSLLKPKLRIKKCKVCGVKFQPFSTLAKCCSFKCAIIHAKAEEKKAFKKETLALKIKLKTRMDWLKEAQTAFNAYIRLRDKDEPCISCGRHHQGQYHAGHYLTTAAHPELRFSEYNVHKQCRPCNEMLSGNIVEYRKNLIKKIGVELVDWLESSQKLQKLTIEDAKEIKQFYKEKKKRLEAENKLKGFM